MSHRGPPISPNEEMTTQYAPPANPSTDRITDSSIWKGKDLQHCVHRGLSSMESSQWMRKNSLSCCLLYAETTTAIKFVGIKSCLLFLTIVAVLDVKELVQSFMLKLLLKIWWVFFQKPVWGQSWIDLFCIMSLGISNSSPFLTLAPTEKSRQILNQVWKQQRTH